MKREVSRKEFFREGAKIAAGISAGIMGARTLSSQEARGETRFTWPWPYATLDAEKVRILGHDGYWSGNGCSYGSFHALIQALRDAIGAPYTDLPTELMIYGHGGTAEWGTLCGALNGAAGVISLVCPKTDSDTLVHELLGWYTQTLFPSDLSNQYAVNHNYTLNKYEQALAQNKSGSPLCHVSVTEWCNTTKIKVGALERKERCARLTGDVAAYAAQILNAHFSSQFSPSYVAPESIAACMTCHGATVLENVHGRMECKQCHGDPHSSAVNTPPEAMPADYQVRQNYPNPFNPTTTIEFSLPQFEHVTVAIYDLNGRLVRPLVENKPYTAGTYSLQWDGRDSFGELVSSGVYFYHFKAGRVTKINSMVLVK